MKQKTLALMVKIAIIMLGIVGIVCFLDLIPGIGIDLVEKNPEMDYFFWPWFIFLELIAIPYYWTLVIGWIISGNIAKDNSFTQKNANRFKTVSIICLAGTGYFFLGNLVLALLSMSHPGILLMSFVVDFVGVALSVCFGMLSLLIMKASKLQEQSDLTI